MANFKKVIIAGSRDFCSEEHYRLLETEMDNYVLTFGLPDEIVSGAARGADRLGERYASENGIEITRFVPDWDRLGKRAGFLRNEDMAKYADTLVAFWDGESRGTKHMIEYAMKRGLDVFLVMTNKNKNNARSGIVPVSE